MDKSAKLTQGLSFSGHWKDMMENSSVLGCFSNPLIKSTKQFCNIIFMRYSVNSINYEMLGDLVDMRVQEKAI